MEKEQFSDEMKAEVHKLRHDMWGLYYKYATGKSDLKKAKSIAVLEAIGLLEEFVYQHW